MNNRARKERQARRWGRYFNHYAGTVQEVAAGGRAAVKILYDGMAGHRYAHAFRYVRRQG